jgi:hypothetical protein
MVLLLVEKSLMSHLQKAMGDWELRWTARLANQILSRIHQIQT